MHVDEYRDAFDPEPVARRVPSYMPGESEPAWRFYARDAIRERGILEAENDDLRKQLKQYKAAMTYWSERAGIYYDAWRRETSGKHSDRAPGGDTGDAGQAPR